MSAGHDIPVSNRNDDFYDRWQIASAISNVIDFSPSNWSTRIAIYGGWGEGKTSVLNFLELQQKNAGNIVIKYSSWGVSIESELWEEFADCFIKGLKQNKIKVGLFHLLKFHVSKLGNLLNKAIQFFATWANKAKVPGVAIVSEYFTSVLTKKLKLNKPFIEKVLTDLENVKIIIFIDDLDRADPRVIPKLLLVLRELLDFPKLSYVLAFDHGIVSRALETYNPAWKESKTNFLDKIVDFSFHLPYPSVVQVKNLALSQFKALAPFVPEEAVREIEEFLPDNPRKLKLFVRMIAGMRVEVDRHEKDELNWQIILMFALLRAENEPFTNEFIFKFLDSNGFSWYSWKIGNASGGGSNQDVKLKELIGKFQGLALVEDRIIALVNALREMSSSNSVEQIKYQASFALSPQNITWGEFKEFFRDWSELTDVELIKAFLNERAELSGNTIKSVQIEFCSTVIDYYSLLLEQASNVSDIQLHTEKTSSLIKLLELMKACFISPGILKESLGEDLTKSWFKIYSVISQWRHFNANENDLLLRDLELNFILELTKSISNKLALYESLSPWSDLEPPLFDERSGSLRKAFYEEVLHNLESVALDQALQYLEHSGEIKKIRSEQKYLAARFLLTNSNSPCFKAENVEKINSVIVRKNILHPLGMMLWTS
jgi:hypothetical protein